MPIKPVGRTAQAKATLPRRTYIARSIFWLGLAALTVLRSYDLAHNSTSQVTFPSIGLFPKTSLAVEDPAGLTAAIKTRWDVAVVWQDPSKFYAWPVSAVPKDLVVSPLEASDVVPALQVVADGLSIFPNSFVRSTISQIFLCGTLNAKGYPLGGLALAGGIYLAASGMSDPENRAYMRDTIFHESSTLVLYKVGLDEPAWNAANPPGFSYAIQNDPDAKLHATHWRDDPSDLDSLYSQGFLLRYGTASLRNDVNTYADAVFGHPRDLIALMHRSPPIARKVALLMAMYLRADPAFRPYFDSTGLAQAAS